MAFFQQRNQSDDLQSPYLIRWDLLILAKMLFLELNRTYTSMLFEYSVKGRLRTEAAIISHT
jgi:hypothetical protein